MLILDLAFTSSWCKKVYRDSTEADNEV